MTPTPSWARASVSGQAPIWRCGGFELSLHRVRIMGILNVTPDSFSDGGRFAYVDAALAHARSMIDEGADVIDIGGESTRPGATPVPPDLEIARVLPVLRELQGICVPVSVDTSQPALMRAALELGASVINDVRALSREGALEAVRGSDCGLIVMHLQGDPATMQLQPSYRDVVDDVSAWLALRYRQVCQAGVAPERIVLDPGFGFGKTHRHNRQLLAGLHRLCTLGSPLLVGLSRKSSLGEITGRTVTDRLAASLAAALMAVERGARIVRVHDVAATRDALAVWESVRSEAQAQPSDEETV
jgi:dihydropteroate synthase